MFEIELGAYLGIPGRYIGPDGGAVMVGGGGYWQWVRKDGATIRRFTHPLSRRFEYYFRDETGQAPVDHWLVRPRQWAPLRAIVGWVQLHHTPGWAGYVEAFWHWPRRAEFFAKAARDLGFQNPGPIVGVLSKIRARLPHSDVMDVSALAGKFEGPLRGPNHERIFLWKNGTVRVQAGRFTIVHWRNPDGQFGMNALFDGHEITVWSNGQRRWTLPDRSYAHLVPNPRTSRARITLYDSRNQSLPDNDEDGLCDAEEEFRGTASPPIFRPRPASHHPRRRAREVRRAGFGCCGCSGILVWVV